MNDGKTPAVQLLAEQPGRTIRKKKKIYSI
jgi:hypothetical protein